MTKTGLFITLALLLPGCTVSSHATRPSTVGLTRSSADLLAVIDQPGPVQLETIASSDWQVNRSGLINLDNPKAKEAGLTDGPEPIQVFFHVLRHPIQGTFIVDTGVEKALRDNPDEAAARGMLASAMKLETMKIHTPLGAWLASEKEPLKGVFITHMHFDHVMGMPDVPKGTPVYSGPGELASRSLMNAFVKRTTDRAFKGQEAVQEWAFQPDPTGRFEGILDIFGDGSVWALWVPGHTPGSTAYVVRTPEGPVLLTGDASHTRWGWDHDVEPGTFTSDGPRGAESFKRLRALATEHPSMQVRLGHQY